MSKSLTLMTMLAKLGLDARQFDIGLDDAVKKATKGSSGITGALGGIATGAAVAVTAITAVTAAAAALAYKLAADAAPLEGIAAAYRGVTGGGDEMLRMMREQSSGMISNRDLMRSYNLAGQLVSKTFADQLPDALGYLNKVAASTGQGMDYMTESLVRGVGRLSPMILDNLGIQVSLTEANEVYAKKIGKTVDALTKQEQQTALMNQVMEKLAVNTANMPEVAGTASQALGAMSTWFKNLRDDVGMAFLPALKELVKFFNMLAPLVTNVVLPALQALGGWVADVTREWTRGFAELIIKAANWGANIVESLAGGITGSDAITRALRNVANTVGMWLKPGSPPKLLPNLTKWGSGAIQAWLDGWSVGTLAQSGFLQKLRTGLRPILDEIDLGKEIDPSRLGQAFGVNATAVAPYLKAYRAVGDATHAVTDAREALATAEEEGDEDAIKAARQKLALAEKDENAARRTFYEAEDRMAKRIAAEVKLTKAIETKAGAEMKAANDSARLAAEAEQRMIAQAYLQYRLAVAGTAAGQIPIWEEELAKTVEGTAEYWNIMTRLVELRRSAAAAAGGAGAGDGAGGMGPAVDEFGKASDSLGKGVGIDWAGIGGAMIDALVEGMIKQIKTIPSKLVLLSYQMLAWAGNAQTQYTLYMAGFSATKWLFDGMVALVLSPFGAKRAGTTITSQMQTVVKNLQGTIRMIGSAIGEGILAGYLSYFMSDAAAQRIAKAVITALSKAIPYITPVGQAKLVWDLLSGEAEKMITEAGERIGQELPEVRDWLQQPAPDWWQDMVGGGAQGKEQADQVIFEKGSIVINAPGGVASEVEYSAEIGVRQGLQAAGVRP